MENKVDFGILTQNVTNVWCNAMHFVQHANDSVTTEFGRRLITLGGGVVDRIDSRNWMVLYVIDSG